MAKQLATTAPATAVAAFTEPAHKPISAGLVVVPPTEIEVLEIPEGQEDTGLEGVTSSERRIPILRILDAKSPACKPVERGGVPGAKAGDILNTATGEVYSGKGGLYIIPAFRDHKYIKYIKREDDGSGGGFVAVLEPEDPEVKLRQDERMEQFGNLFGKLAAGQNENGKDLELVETYYLYCLCVKPGPNGEYLGAFGEFFPALVPFDSTKIKAYNSYIERCKNMRYMVKVGGSAVATPREIAIWAHVWHLVTAFKERGQQNWYIWGLSLAAKNEDGTEKKYSASRLDRNDPIYMGAEDLRTTVLEGNAQVAYDKDQQDGTQGGGGSRNTRTGGGSDDIPLGDDDQQ